MPLYKDPDMIAIQEHNLMDNVMWSEMRKHIRKAFDDEHKALLIFQYISGCRPVELSNLTRDRFDLTEVYDGISVRIPKSKKGYERMIVIPVCNEETEWLRNVYLKDMFPKEYVFPELTKRKNPRDFFQYLNRRTGVGRFHDDNGVDRLYPFHAYFFRHNIASLLYQNGASDMLVKFYQGKKLGDYRSSTTSYIHGSLQIANEVKLVLKRILDK